MSKEQLEAELAGLVAGLYATAYNAGHRDTVESNYTDVLPVDQDTYWLDAEAVQEAIASILANKELYNTATTLPEAVSDGVWTAADDAAAACRCVDCGGDQPGHDPRCAYMRDLHGFQPAADCTCPHQDAGEPDHDAACPARLSQQPADVDDVMVAKLTKDQRTRLVEKLVADQSESAERVSLYLWDILENGFKGYDNYTDQELLDAHLGAFDEDFFDLESEDDQ